MSFTYDLATYSELKRALQRDPSGYKLTQLTTASVQLSPNTPEQTVYIFPYDPTSKLRKLEVTGNGRHFTYVIKAMSNPATDAAWSIIYSDIGGALFAETELANSFDNVKTSLSEWVDKANAKRDARREAGSSSKPDPTGQASGTSSITCSPSHASEDSDRQECVNRQSEILQTIIAERDSKLKALQLGISRFVFCMTNALIDLH